MAAIDLGPSVPSILSAGVAPAALSACCTWAGVTMGSRVGGAPVALETTCATATGVACVAVATTASAWIEAALEATSPRMTTAPLGRRPATMGRVPGAVILGTARARAFWMCEWSAGW